jgi:hypothetical protein
MSKEQVAGIDVKPEKRTPSMTPNAIRMRERNQKKRDQKIAKAVEEGLITISTDWLKNENQLINDDPALRDRLQARHKEVEELMAEAAEIIQGVEKGLRAETRSAETADSAELFPMPDLCYRDAKAHILANGTASYQAVEADIITGKPLDEISRHYQRYGYRLRIASDTFQSLRESLILYGLRTRDRNLDWKVVEEAIADHLSYQGFSPNAGRLRDLICEHRHQPQQIVII